MEGTIIRKIIPAIKPPKPSDELGKIITNINAAIKAKIKVEKFILD